MMNKLYVIVAFAHFWAFKSVLWVVLVKCYEISVSLYKCVCACSNFFSDCNSKVTDSWGRKLEELMIVVISSSSFRPHKSVIFELQSLKKFEKARVDLVWNTHEYYKVPCVIMPWTRRYTPWTHGITPWTYGITPWTREIMSCFTREIGVMGN